MADASSSRTPEAERMSRLIQEYQREDDSLEDAVESTSQGALLLSLKYQLEANEIEDRGVGRPEGIPHYGLSEHIYQKVDRVVGELQYFLQRSATLVNGHERYFRIDPEDAILPLLAGRSNKAQLLVAWGILRKRLELGRQFFEKYVKEFNHPNGIEDYSPVSTTVELSEGLRVQEIFDLKLRHACLLSPP
jgi:hypothetical protein